MKSNSFQYKTGKSITFLLILVVPLVFLITSLVIRFNLGPFYYGINDDPSYAYLISSLNISTGHKVFHTDHPGVPVQFIGAGVIKFIHSLSDEADGLAESIFKNPEKYIRAIDRIMIYLNFTGLIFMGFVIFSSLKNIYSTILFQSSSLFAFVLFNISGNNLLTRLNQVSAECFLSLVLIILITLLIKYIYHQNLTNKNYKQYSVLFGIVCGIGLLTKILFLSVLIIPLIIIPGVYKKLLFLTVTCITFFGILVIKINNLGFYMSYLYDTLTKSGRYGTGAAGIVDKDVYIVNLFRAVEINFVLFIVLAVVIICFLLALTKREYNILIRHKNEITLLGAVILCSVLNIILVLKNYYQHYLLISVSFSVLTIYLVISIYRDYITKFISYNKITAIIIVILFLYVGVNYKKHLNYITFEEREASKIIEFVKSYDPNTLLILPFGVSNRDEALFTSLIWSGTQQENYKNLLSKNSRNEIFYDLYSKNLNDVSIEKKSYDIEKVKIKLLSRQKILFICRKYVVEYDLPQALVKILKDDYNFKNCKLVKVFSNNNYESVYELNIEP